MTFSPDKSPKGNISTERERGERNSFHDRSSTTSSQKRKFKKATNIESTLSPIDDVSPMFRTKKRPATILLFVPSEIRGEFFEASAFSCVSKNLWNGENGWKKHFAAMKENRKAIYFLWELRRVRGSIASKAFVTVTYFQRNEGRGLVSPEGHFSRQRNIFNEYPCIFQCAYIDKLILGDCGCSSVVLSRFDGGKVSCFVTCAISRCSLVEGSGGGAAQEKGQR